jgi:hypothetical protein
MSVDEGLFAWIEEAFERSASAPPKEEAAQA